MPDMFQIAEIGAALPKAGFARMQPQLRLDLITLQQKARKAGVPTLIVLGGIRGAGVIDTVNLLNTWMDPRWIATQAFDTPSDEERERPLFWRYWRSLPAAGSTGLYIGGWHLDALMARCKGELTDANFHRRLDQIDAFERTLADEGALILKFWLHLSKSRQKKILPRLETDPLVGFRPSDNTFATPPDYDQYTSLAAVAIRRTADPARPWFIVEGADDNYRRASVLSALADRLTERLTAPRRAPKRQTRKRNPAKVRNVLAKIKMGRALTQAAYKKAFHREQLRLHALQQRAREAGLSTVVVFEGWDAAGKGGAIRRLTYALNARDYRIVPIAAPTDEERRHHYLWRFWRALGRAGDMTVFDRSWYGRVLVERVENLIGEPQWKRAYDEINGFERQLYERGHVVVKIWLHITRDEQRRRFAERRSTPYKMWKLTADDWRNRKNWARYEAAINEMIGNTSNRTTPWTLIGANDKRRARIAVLQTVSNAIERGLKRLKK